MNNHSDPTSEEITTPLVFVKQGVVDVLQKASRRSVDWGEGDPGAVGL